MGDEQVENVEVIHTVMVSTWRWAWVAIRAAASSRSTVRNRPVRHAGHPCHRRVSEAGGIAAFIDASHAFDRFYAEKSAWMSTTLDLAADNGEQALQIADQPS